MSSLWHFIRGAPYTSRWILLQRHAVLLTLLSVVLCVVCAIDVQKLIIHSDFKRMLPETYPSVKALEKIEQRVQSTSTLHVLVGGEDWPSMRRFIDNFVAEIPKQLPGVIDRIEYNATATEDFFQRHKFLFASMDDLQTIHDRLKQRIDYEKFRRNPFAIELTDPPSLDFSDIEERYRQKHALRSTQFRDGYFTNADATLAIVVLKPREGATDSKYAKKLMGQVRAVADSLKPQSYHPSMKFGFGGRYQKVVVEFDTVVGDMLRTLALCAVLVGGVVWYYFRRFRMVFLMICAAGLGTLGALETARLCIGYLTAQTAFLGSIILGNGINYSLILMARYLEERRRGLTHDLAFVQSLQGTWKPTLASGATTMVAFAALSISNIRGLSQFAFIGSIGMLYCWLSTYLFLPAWLQLSERLFPIRHLERRADNMNPFKGIMQWVAHHIQSHPQKVLKIAGVVTGVSMVIFALYLPNSLEYNFNNLRFRPTTNHDTWEAWARDQARPVFGQSGSPNVILTDRLDQAQQVCASIEARAAHMKTSDGRDVLEGCKTLFTYLPLDQDAKLEKLAQIRELLKDVSDDELKDYRDRVAELRATENLQPIIIDDLPQTLREAYREQNGAEGLIAYVYPAEAVNLWDGRELVKFATLLRTITFPNGETLQSSGELVIFADLLDAVINEGPKAVTFSFVMVLVVIWITFRRHRGAAFAIMGTLAVGITWMLALFPAAQVKLNFVNFVALPITFGIGVDYAVNIYGRYLQEGEGSIRHVLTHVGGAVVLCSLTTIFGYAVLLISHNRALVSLGMASLVGEITCLLAALFVMPAIFQWQENRRQQPIMSQKISCSKQESC